MGQFTEEELDIFMELLNDKIFSESCFKSEAERFWDIEDEERLQQLIALRQKARKVEVARE